jgi:hypothetical protein
MACMMASYVIKEQVAWLPVLMVGLTLFPNLRLQSLVVLALWDGRQADWRLSQHSRSSG